MATLADLISPRGDVQGVPVYALTIEDLAGLIANHRNAFEKLFNGANFSIIAQECPEFVSSVIAKSTRESEEVAMQLPAGIQLEILDKVWQLSELNSNTLGNLIAGMMIGMKNIAEKLPH